MVRLDNVSKQHGPQILFVDASAAIQRGEKIGLVGPDGAGKSFVSHAHRFLDALSNRVLELVPEGANTYGGGYLEYVARSGHGPAALRLGAR